MNYEVTVDLILQEVSKIMREAGRAHGVTIEIEANMEEVPTITYEIREKVILDGIDS